jgi:hypothetical protein
MRKLSLFIIAAGATLGVSLAHADEVTDTSTATDAPEVQVDPVVELNVDPVVELDVDPVPADTSDDAVDPLLVEELELHPVDQVLELTEDSGAPALGVVGADTDDVKSEETAVPDGEAVTDDTATTDDTDADPSTLDDSLVYTTTGMDTGSTRGPEGCMECRTLTGEAAAVEAPAPEVMVDVLDGNSTGVDVMDPVEGKKRSSH